MRTYTDKQILETIKKRFGDFIFEQIEAFELGDLEEFLTEEEALKIDMDLQELYAWLNGEEYGDGVKRDTTEPYIHTSDVL